LCKMRSTLSTVLSEVLVGGFAHDPSSKDLPEPLPFSGCYFAATGDNEDQQAFIRGVFEKLNEEQEDVEWTRQSVGNNKRWMTIGITCTAIAGVCLIGIVAVAIWRIVT